MLPRHESKPRREAAAAFKDLHRRSEGLYRKGCDRTYSGHRLQPPRGIGVFRQRRCGFGLLLDAVRLLRDLINQIEALVSDGRKYWHIRVAQRCLDTSDVFEAVWEAQPVLVED